MKNGYVSGSRQYKAASFAMFAGFLLVGCQGGFVDREHVVEPIAGSALRGSVHGGQQAVSGASIILYAAGVSGNRVGAVNLLLPNVVTTDARGGFDITGDYQCPSASSQVYIVARGGNPGLSAGTNNPALVLVAALGDCGNLTASTFISINEVTTVAAAWALSQFAGGTTLGANSSNKNGLHNAFGTASNLVSPYSGRSPGALPLGASTESAKINSLANALAMCVNSDGTSLCQALFGATTQGSMVPTNTFDAALNIARNPAANIAAIFSLQSAMAPFQPSLSVAPNDWTLTVTYGACSRGCGGLNLPGDLAIDAAGNVWVANYFGSVVSKFSAIGVALAPDGFPGAGLRQSYGVAIDSAGYVWVANQQSVTAAGNSHRGSVSLFSPSGTELSGPGYTTGGLFYPEAVAGDSNGNMWFANYGSSSSTLLSPNGSALSPSTGFGASQLPFASAVAVDGFHNAWFAVQGGIATVTPAGAVSSFSCCGEPSGLAVDQNGNIWVADYGSFGIVEMNSTGTVLHRISTASGPTSPQALAVDGAGNIWTANYYGNSITALLGSTASATSPAAGYGRDGGLNEPYSIAIDSSGNLWLSNSGNDTLTQVVGLAAPIATPLLGPPTQP